MKEIFELKNQEDIESLLHCIEYGTLALCVDNTPYSVPVNFVYYNHAIYFHGSLKGKKLSILAANNKVSFSVVQDLALLPSYFSTDDGNACPATQFFSSIILQGTAHVIDVLEEKAEVLQALMQKLQKEGGYEPLAVNARYEKMLKATSVVKIEIEHMSAKVKCAQHKSSEIQEKIIENLQKRGTQKDLRSLESMKKYID